MLSHLKLHFIKQTINFVTFIADKLLPGTQPKYPQTLILKRVFKRLKYVYAVERFAKRFNDDNFKRLLDVVYRALAFISEEDRYYRQWLALTYLLIMEELEKERNSLSYVDFVRLCKEQWQLNYQIITPHHYEANKNLLFPVVLTDFLFNLARRSPP